MTTFSQIALTFLLNATWQIVIVAVTARLCDKLLQKGPTRYRHWLWVAALVLCLLLPLLSAVDLFHGEEPTAAARAMISIQVEAGETALPPASSALSTLIRNRPRTFSPTPILTVLALGCYLLSLLIHTVNLWRAWRRTTSMLATAYSRAVPSLLVAVKARCQTTFGLDDISLLCSPEIAAPVTAGRRTILWPEPLFDCDLRGVVTAALGHEMAHLKRHDFALNLLYELLTLPIAFHPALTFIKRQIKHTRELACDELVTETLLDAPMYARSLLALADSRAAFRRPNYTLGVFDADILEERIMKLIERKPRLSRRNARALLVAASLVITLSSAVAVACSLKVEQPSAKSIVGNWEMYMTEDGQDPKGTALEFPVGLNLQLADDKLVGKASFPWMQETAEGANKTGTSVAALNSLTYAENKLFFKIEGTDKGDFLEMKLQLVGEKFEGRWKILRSGEAGSVKMQRVQAATSSLLEKIVGEWLVKILTENGVEASGVNLVLQVKADGEKLTAKTIFDMNGEKKEWVLIDPKFDGETFHFKVNNGDEVLEGKLKLVEDRFEGPWKGSESGAGGTMKLVRKK